METFDKKAFDDWCKKFEESQDEEYKQEYSDGKAAIELLGYELKGRTGREIPKHLDKLEKDRIKEKDFLWLKSNILEVCYNAATYGHDNNRKLREEGRDAKRFFQNFKGLKNTRKRLREYPVAARQAVVKTIWELRDKQIEISHNEDDKVIDVFDTILRVLDENLQKTDNEFMHWNQSCALLFNKPIGKRDDPVMDSFIFHFYFIIKTYLQRGSVDLIPGMLLPKVYFGELKEIVSEFATVTFKKEISVERIEERIKALQREKAMYMSWKRGEN